MSANTKDRNGQLHPQIVGNWSTNSALVVNSSSVATPPPKYSFLSSTSTFMPALAR